MALTLPPWSHEEVVVDVELLPLQHGRQQLGTADDLRISGGVFVHVRHDPDTLESTS